MNNPKYEYQEFLKSLEMNNPTNQNSDSSEDDETISSNTSSNSDSSSTYSDSDVESKIEFETSRPEYLNKDGSDKYESEKNNNKEQLSDNEYIKQRLEVHKPNYTEEITSNDLKYYTKEKSTVFTLNSKDRLKTDHFTFSNSVNVSDIFNFTLNSNEIEVYLPNHGQENEFYFIVILNSYGENTQNNTICGIDIENIAFNKDKNRPFHMGIALDKRVDNRDKIINGKFQSDYFKFSINQFANKTALNQGGSIVFKKIDDQLKGYSHPNYYKISLPYKFTNIKSVKLIGSEIPNTQPIINDNERIRDTINNFVDSQIYVYRRNTKLFWIIKDDFRVKSDGTIEYYEYSIDLPENNFTIDKLTSKILSLVNVLPRREWDANNSRWIFKQNLDITSPDIFTFNNFVISFNSANYSISFYNLDAKVIIPANSLTTIRNNNILHINFIDIYGTKIYPQIIPGNQIFIKNANNTSGVNSSMINTVHTIFPNELYVIYVKLNDRNTVTSPLVDALGSPLSIYRNTVQNIDTSNTLDYNTDIDKQKRLYEINTVLSLVPKTNGSNQTVDAGDTVLTTGADIYYAKNEFAISSFNFISFMTDLATNNGDNLVQDAEGINHYDIQIIDGPGAGKVRRITEILEKTVITTNISVQTTTTIKTIRVNREWDSDDLLTTSSKFKIYPKYDIGKISSIDTSANTITMDTKFTTYAPILDDDSATYPQKNWNANEWANYYLVITSGVNKGVIRKIVSNTVDTLTYSTDVSTLNYSGTISDADTSEQNIKGTFNIFNGEIFSHEWISRTLNTNYQSTSGLDSEAIQSETEIPAPSNTFGEHLAGSKSGAIGQVVFSFQEIYYPNSDNLYTSSSGISEKNYQLPKRSADQSVYGRIVYTIIGQDPSKYANFHTVFGKNDKSKAYKNFTLNENLVGRTSEVSFTTISNPYKLSTFEFNGRFGTFKESSTSNYPSDTPLPNSIHLDNLDDTDQYFVDPTKFETFRDSNTLLASNLETYLTVTESSNSEVWNQRGLYPPEMLHYMFTMPNDTGSIDHNHNYGERNTSGIRSQYIVYGDTTNSMGYMVDMALNSNILKPLVFAEDPTDPNIDVEINSDTWRNSTKYGWNDCRGNFNVKNKNNRTGIAGGGIIDSVFSMPKYMVYYHPFDNFGNYPFIHLFDYPSYFNITDPYKRLRSLINGSDFITIYEQLFGTYSERNDNYVYASPNVGASYSVSKFFNNNEKIFFVPHRQIPIWNGSHSYNNFLYKILDLDSTIFSDNEFDYYVMLLKNFFYTQDQIWLDDDGDNVLDSINNTQEKQILNMDLNLTERELIIEYGISSLVGFEYYNSDNVRINRHMDFFKWSKFMGSDESEAIKYFNIPYLWKSIDFNPGISSQDIFPTNQYNTLLSVDDSNFSTDKKVKKLDVYFNKFIPRVIPKRLQYELDSTDNVIEDSYIYNDRNDRFYVPLRFSGLIHTGQNLITDYEYLKTTLPNMTNDDYVFLSDTSGNISWSNLVLNETINNLALPLYDVTTYLKHYLENVDGKFFYIVLTHDLTADDYPDTTVFGIYFQIHCNLEKASNTDYFYYSKYVNTLTGTVTKNSTSSLSGTNTLFNSELIATPGVSGDLIQINNDIREIDEITDDTSLTVTEAFTDSDTIGTNSICVIVNTQSSVTREISCNGFISVSENSNIVTGDSSSFLSEFSIGDIIKFNNGSINIYRKIVQINSDTELIVNISYIASQVTTTTTYHKIKDFSGLTPGDMELYLNNAKHYDTSSSTTKQFSDKLNDDIHIIKVPIYLSLDLYNYSSTVNGFDLSINLNEQLISQLKHHLDNYNYKGSLTTTPNTNTKIFNLNYQGFKNCDISDGTISIDSGSTTVTGTDTNFISQIEVGDKIQIKDATSDDLYTVKTVENINSNTELIIDSTISDTNSYTSKTMFIIKNHSYLKYVSTDENTYTSIASRKDDLITYINAKKSELNYFVNSDSKTYDAYDVNSFKIEIERSKEDIYPIGDVSQNIYFTATNFFTGSSKLTLNTFLDMKFLFSKNNTFGNLLGFPYVGQESGDTAFQKITSNEEIYEKIYIEKSTYTESSSAQLSNNLVELKIHPISISKKISEIFTEGDTIYIKNHINHTDNKITNTNSINDKKLTINRIFSDNTLSVIIKDPDLLNELNLKDSDSIIGTGGYILVKRFNKPYKLTGPTSIYLQIPQLGNIVTSDNVKDVFAKILLNTSPGSVLFNTFISNAKIFTQAPLSELEELEIRFVDQDNQIYDFGNSDHSLTFEIIEYVKIMEGLNKSSKTGSVDVITNADRVI